jgi:CHAT domain-containing protein
MSAALDLIILDADSDRHVVALARAGADCAIAQLPFRKQLKQLTEFRDWIESAVRGSKAPPSSSELQSFGEGLFAFTFRDEIMELYSRLPKDDVRIHMWCNRAEVQSLPWEYLQEPRTKRGPQRGRSVIRVVPTIGREVPEPPRLGADVRVLFASAAPTDQGVVGWEDVRDAVQRAFDVNLPDGVTLKLVDGADPKILRKAIADETFDIFHFSGHGQVSRDGKGQLILVNRKTQKSQPLDSEQVCAILAGRGIRLVVLSACMTAAGDFRDDFSVIAAALVRSGIPAVVANQMPVSNKTISPFVGELYSKLIKSGDIDLAMTEGRIALYADLAKDSSSRLEWGIPTLYRHYDGAQLYQP